MLDWLVPAAYAAGATTPAPGAGSPFGQYGSLIMIIGMMVVMYYFLIAMPQKKRQRERDSLLKSMKRGDEVLTASGIYGKITGVADQTVNLEIAPKVRIKVHKSAITQVTASAAAEEEPKE